MMDRIGNNSSLARSAIESALKRQSESLEQLRNRAEELKGNQATGETAESGFTEMLKQGIQEVDGAVKSAERVHLDVVQGKLDFHEVAAQLKQSELTFDFAMQIRNKLIDSYREVMRMSV